ncbi:MAG: PIN domain-containing protein [Planctomycetaceae bacterium]|nr:PIN domain-containing protein [Planctomycetaceae bacterium]
MGSITLPNSGVIAVDANIVIYTVEKHPKYSPLLRPLWESVETGKLVVVMSELVLLETLVGPYRAGLSQLAADYESFLSFTGIRLVPISPAILRAAAEMRAKVPKLRSPDAIHAVTAIHQAASCFLTNDLGFRNIAGFNVILLDEALTTHP